MPDHLSTDDRLARRFREQFRPSVVLRRALRLSGLLSILRAVMAIAGIFALGWDPFELVAFYVFETIAIGLFNVPKILLVRAPEPPGTTGGGRLFTALFFVAHYGFFVALQSTLIVTSLGDGRDLLSTVASGEGFAWALASIAGFELVEFTQGFLATGARDRRSPTLQMFQPYARIFVQQLVVILGGWGSLALRGSTLAVWYLLVLVVVRLWSDLVFASFFSEILDESMPQAEPAR